jgi:hypothetical protein
MSHTNDVGRGLMIAPNGLKHGLFARETVIRGEDEQEFEEYPENLLNQLIPRTLVASASCR